MFFTKGYAQYTISGKLHAESAIGISRIAIKLTNASDKPVYTQSDSLGLYRFNLLKEGKYSLVFSGLNFETANLHLYLKGDTSIDVVLKEKTHVLAEVNIASEQLLTESKTDRTVFNVEKSIAATGSDALELLAKLPRVRVMNDRVSLVGKGSVNVMVNDRLVPVSDDDLSNYLKSLSAAEIAKVEVITNPPARYDAQGNSGSINIVLKKPVTNGMNGSVNTVFTQATYLTASAGGTLSYRNNKIAVNSNFNLRKGSVVPLEQSRVFYPGQTREVINRDRNYRAVASGQIGLEYQPSRQTLLGVSYSGGVTNFHSDENISTNIFNGANHIDSVLHSDANARIKSHYHSANLYLKKTLSPSGKALTVNGDWFKYNDDKERYFNSTTYLGSGVIVPSSFAAFLSGSGQTVDLYTLKTDLDLPLKIFKLSLGAKLSFIKNQSDIGFYRKEDGVYLPDLSQDNLFDYEENTQSAYFSLGKTTGKWDFQAGLRGEYTQVNGTTLNDTNRSRYFQLFPTFYAVYRAGENNSWNFNYGRRINRPPYKKLNPFRWYSNPSVYAEGNPFLLPSYNDNLEISYTYRNRFTTTLSFAKTSNGFADVNFVDAGSYFQVSRPLNFLTCYSYQLSQSVSVKPFRVWQSVNQFNVFHNVSHSAIAEALYRLNGIGAYFSTLNQLLFNPAKTFFGDVYFWYQFPAVDGLSKNRAQYNLDLGLKTLLFNKQLQVAVNVNDVLKTNQYHFENEVNHIRQEYLNYYDSRSFRISVRYNFGNEKVKQSEHRTGNEEERRRN
ncbi:outer membrane beta-barrel family protein [Pedobacter frigidisoli]|uniref:outer membrane beta-barrel family protein n=1 Tax=Pedobacter frigidisoli TaxID=2530455 RepID=UPI00292D0E95|nr:outer membrane beta-barrel family protein [Pedobacter frigidisoli]